MADYHPLYLRGIACFNRQAYFSAHEVWEDLWRDEEGEAKDFYKGLIQAAVALYHLTNGNLLGARSLYAGCQRLLEPYRPKYLGFDLEGLLSQLAVCFLGLPEPVDRASRQRIVLEAVPQIALDRAG